MKNLNPPPQQNGGARIRLLVGVLCVIGLSLLGLGNASSGVLSASQMASAGSSSYQGDEKKTTWGDVGSIARDVIEQFDEAPSSEAGAELFTLSESLRSTKFTGGISDFSSIKFGELQTFVRLFCDRLIEVGYIDKYALNLAPFRRSELSSVNLPLVERMFTFDLLEDNDDPSNCHLDWWEGYYSGSAGNDPSLLRPCGGMTIQETYLGGSNLLISAETEGETPNRGSPGSNSTSAKSSQSGEGMGSGGAGEMVAVGNGHIFSKKSDATLTTWGSNLYRELGIGTTALQWHSVQIAASSNISFVAGGSNFSVAAKNNATVWTWGNNSNGEFGDSPTTSRTSPVRVILVDGTTPLSGLSAVSAGDNSIVL